MLKDIKEKILLYHWEPWLQRDLYAFMISIVAGSYSQESFKKYGFGDWGLKASLFTNGYFYSSPEIFKEAEIKTKKWLTDHKIEEISFLLESFLEEKRQAIKILAKDNKTNLKKKLSILEEIFHQAGSFAWTAHILEPVLWSQLRQQTLKYVSKNLDKFIGDAAYPSKKNALELMEDDMRSGVDIKKIWEKYRWMRSRDGFARPYTLSELEQYRLGLSPFRAHIYPPIPTSLFSLYQEARELVYLRTLRTNVLHELLFHSRPILKETARTYSLSFQDLKYFSFSSLVSGCPRRYSKNFSCLDFEGNFVLIDGPVSIEEQEIKIFDNIKGMIAQSGRARGRVAIVNKVSESSKVKEGDVLVTCMTSPDFLPAMKKALAFVTDEGGLTCHAAIIAREMKKPCIIGTKIATKVLKDGDLVEVDANKGEVKIIEKK